MIQKLELFLYKAQTSLNYDYTAAGAATFAGTDLLECLAGSKIDSEPEVETVVNVAGALDQDPAIPGREPSKGTINMKMTPALNAGKTLPPWAVMLCGSCAFTSAATTNNPAPSNFELTPVSVFTVAGILAYYTGNLETSGSLIFKHYNLVGDWKISINANKAPEISFTLDGAFYGQTTGTQPSVTKGRTSALAFKGATINIGGVSTYKLISAEITGNQVPQTTEAPDQANGMGYSTITDRKIKFTAKVYSTTVEDPKTAIRNSTEGAIDFKWGSAGTAVEIKGSYSQLTKCAGSEQNGIHTWDLEGQWNRNDFKIDLNPA
jgi:hypothetical protein